MPRTWVILGRVLRVPLLAPGDAPAGGEDEAEVERHSEEAHGMADAEHDAEAHGMAEVEAADAQARGGLETHDEAAAQHGADFSIPLAEPPRITVMTVVPTAHLIHEYPDSHPYIVSVDTGCILLNFGVDPFKVAGFDDDRPYQSNLILVRDYNWAGVEQGHPITATAERIPPRCGGHPAVTNVESIGIIYDPEDYDYVIAELMIDKGCERAMLLSSHAGLRGDWIQDTTDNPLPLLERDREWIPSGVVSCKKMLWWFDLSWGIISSGPMLLTADPSLLFHRLPEGHDLNQAQRGMHDRRCIAVSRDCLRYVAITTDGDAAATVSMWTRVPSAYFHDDTVGWKWRKEFTVSFAEIWEHDCYTATGLPRKVPVLAAVSPSNDKVVYFALADQKKRLFGVNMYQREVEEFIDESYELLMPGPDAPPSCRYVLPWFLPLEISRAIGNEDDDDDDDDDDDYDDDNDDDDVAINEDDVAENEEQVEQQVPEMDDEEEEEGEGEQQVAEMDDDEQEVGETGEEEKLEQQVAKMDDEEIPENRTGTCRPRGGIGKKRQRDDGR